MKIVSPAMGLGLGTQAKPCLRVVTAMFFIAFLSVFYFFSDVTTDSYIELIRKTADFDSDFDYGGTTGYANETLQHAENMSHAPRDGYLVWNPSCRIPDIDPRHESIRRLIKTTDPVPCSTLPPLTKINGDNLILVKDVIHLYSPKNIVSCCYHEIYRHDRPVDTTDKHPDDVYTMTGCKPFNSSVKLTDNEQFLMAKCSTTKGKAWREIYTNMHAVVRKRTKLADKINMASAEGKQKMSVLIVGIDSISRLNMIRTMPKTVNFLQKQGWLELRGYNKMDDNTFPNLMAILTGHSVKQIRNLCFPNNSHPVDACPLMWKEFSEKGYITLYGEDEPSIGTFNYHKKGFIKSPTDYYLRPFMLAAEKHTKIKKKDGLNVCLGPTPSSEHILRYAADFATTFRNTLYFALFWMNSFSHNNVNTPSSMDARFLKFFHELVNNDALNNTMVIFLSDHGMRFGKIRETFVGWLEERLPFIYIWVPEWYRNLYPQKYNNLVENSYRLTSPYDLHLTLQEVLRDEHDNGTAACPKCVSLFDEAPWNRSCEDVGVTEHWCTCSEYRTLSTQGGQVRAMVKFTLGEINKIIKNGQQFIKNNKTKCAKLSVKRVLSVRSKVFERKVGHDEYVVLFETLPGEALFEATVRRGVQFKLLDTVSRINAFGSQSRCMNDAFIKKYCYCVKA